MPSPISRFVRRFLPRLFQDRIIDDPTERTIRSLNKREERRRDGRRGIKIVEENGGRLCSGEEKRSKGKKKKRESDHFFFFSFSFVDNGTLNIGVGVRTGRE